MLGPIAHRHAAALLLVSACSSRVAEPPPPSRDTPASLASAPPNSAGPRTFQLKEPPPKLALTRCLGRSGDAWSPVPVVGEAAAPADEATLPAAERIADQRSAEVTTTFVRACYESAHRLDPKLSGWLVLRSSHAPDGEPDEVCVGADDSLAVAGVARCALRAMISRGFFHATTGKRRTVTGWYGFRQQAAADAPGRSH